MRNPRGPALIGAAFTLLLVILAAMLNNSTVFAAAVAVDVLLAVLGVAYYRGWLGMPPERNDGAARRLRVAQGHIRTSIQAWSNESGFRADPLRYQIHEFREPTTEARDVIAEFWPDRLHDLDAALANDAGLTEYEWRRTALARLDAVIGSILNR